MLDNGAFTYWKRDNGSDRTWDAYYSWAYQWLDYQTTWAVIPDVINGTEAENDHLICEWFAKVGTFRQAAPVWHLHESLDRLDRLVRGFDKVCIGSSGEYAQISSPSWNNRMNDAFNKVICKGSGRPLTWVHMLRGMSLSGSIYPFASVDSTDVARNHLQVPGKARKMVQRWDALQCPGKWTQQPVQMELAHASRD